MTGFTASRRNAMHVSTVPRWPAVLLGSYAVLATISLTQGILDVLIPAVTGARPFSFLFAMTELYGPSFFAVYVYLHNLGLACLVPGFGFIAVRYEKKKSNRGLIGIILAGAVVVSLLVALEYMVQTPGRFDLAFSIPLFLGEATGVLLLAIPAAREMRDFVPTPRYGWSLMTPLRRLALPFCASIVILAVLTAVETVAVLGL